MSQSESPVIMQPTKKMSISKDQYGMDQKQETREILNELWKSSVCYSVQPPIFQEEIKGPKIQNQNQNQNQTQSETQTETPDQTQCINTKDELSLLKMRATVSECHRMMEKFFEFAQIMVAKLQDCQNSLLQLNEKTLSNHQRFSELHLDDKLKELENWKENQKQNDYIFRQILDNTEINQKLFDALQQQNQAILSIQTQMMNYFLLNSQNQYNDQQFISKEPFQTKLFKNELNSVEEKNYEDEIQKNQSNSPRKDFQEKVKQIDLTHDEPGSELNNQNVCNNPKKRKLIDSPCPLIPLTRSIAARTRSNVRI